MGKRALVIGSGIRGMSCAIALRRSGWSVELIDIDPAWRALGAGLPLGARRSERSNSLAFWMISRRAARFR